MRQIIFFLRQLGPVMLSSTYEHLYLTFIAMVLAIAIALPVGIYLTRTRWPRLETVVMNIANTIQTIPSLALIALIVIIFALLRPIVQLPTIGVLPGITALVLYALLPILRNTYTGIKQIDPSIVEVAKGMGMTSNQVLFSVELPLSLPVIMAGIRISTVWTIGVAALVSLIGAGGLGDLIMRGLRTIRMDYLLAGTLPAACLALAADWLLGFLQKWLVPAGIKQQT